MALIIAGKIVPLDRSDPDAVFKGCVFVDESSGTIDSVVKGAVPSKAKRPAAFAQATVIDVGDAYVLPGLIDLHNHIGYNALPPWIEETQKTPFAHHDSWTRARSYQKSITWPANALVKAAPEALLAYVQLRALVGGTTAIQGWPSANRKSVQVLRNIDDETAGTTNHSLIFTSALTKGPQELAQMALAQRQGAGFIYHCAEGQLGSLVQREFVDAANAGCLENRFIGIHCNAITKAEWRRWAPGSAGAVAWSPFSNLWLYGSTTDIGSARAQKVSVCLGSDWGPSGTKNVQGELKVAALVGGTLAPPIQDKELVHMVTANPGDALSRCWKKTIGRLEPGAFADITVFRPKAGKTVWAHVAESNEDDVMLVVYAGVPRYGDSALMRKAKLSFTSPIKIAGRNRLFSIPDPENAGKAFTWAQIKARLDAVRLNPKAELDRAEGRRRAYAGPMDAAEAPLELVLDMPGGAIPLAGGSFMEHAAEIEVPRLPSLVHDADFFASLRKNPFHNGVLDGMARFYP